MSNPGDKTAKYINCAGNHLLDNCLSLIEKTLRKQISFLPKNKFSYDFLQPMKQRHNGKTYDQSLNY